MTSTVAGSAAFEESVSADEVALAVDTVAHDSLAPVSSWSAKTARAAAFSKKELWSVLVVSGLLHAGAAAAAYGTEKAPPAKRISRVEIELARPPERPKPATAPIAPPPPPKLVKPEPKPLAAAPLPTELPSQPPSDTGSSAPAAEDGELHAGTGGLGVEPPKPPAPPAPVVAPAPPAATVQAREGANYLKNPRPAYPRRAKRDGLEGTTLLRILVQASGKPSTVKVQQTSGHDVLDEAAVEAVSRWSFVPATQGGAAVAGYVTVPIVFRLQ